MQSLLSDSFNRQQKPSIKNQDKPQDYEEQQDESKREEEQQNQSESHPLAIIQRKKSQSSEQLQPMKDAFQSDDSYLIVTEEIREERLMGEAINNGSDINIGKGLGSGGVNNEGSSTNIKSKRISKRNKGFHWKLMWVKQQNAVAGSKPLWLQKWVRVKVPAETQDLLEQPNEDQKMENQIDAAN